jgi:hypothetical protein
MSRVILVYFYKENNNNNNNNNNNKKRRKKKKDKKKYYICMQSHCIQLPVIRAKLELNLCGKQGWNMELLTMGAKI